MKRSKWKGVYYKLKPKNFKGSHSLKSLRVSRNSSIIPAFIGQTFQVYSGKNLKKITITKEMVGHKFGEFCKTRSDFDFKKKRKKK